MSGCTATTSKRTFGTPSFSAAGQLLLRPLTAVDLKRVASDVAGFRVAGQIQDRVRNFLRPRESRDWLIRQHLRGGLFLRNAKVMDQWCIDGSGTDAIHAYIVCASSIARVFVNVTTAPFEAQYAVVYGRPRIPAIDAVLTIAPPPALISSGTAYLQPSHVDIEYTIPIILG
jgi:hypothetical protein